MVSLDVETLARHLLTQYQTATSFANISLAMSSGSVLSHCPIWIGVRQDETLGAT
jgi:hypothetical protein